ncbi:MAG: CBS domain-containing protein [Planctomyces sp.]|nr:CBS domain-containing protein [Planctomyces sp.]
MATLSELMRRKTRPELISAAPEETVLQATQRMNEYGIGCLLVLDNSGMVGIFTERDVLRRVVAEELKPSDVLVRDVMTTKVACCSPDLPVEDARLIMKAHRVRHLPIVNHEGHVLGLISIGDLNAHDANNREVEIHYLQEYLHGRV